MILGTTGKLGQVILDTTGKLGQVILDTSGKLGQVIFCTTGKLEEAIFWLPQKNWHRYHKQTRRGDLSTTGKPNFNRYLRLSFISSLISFGWINSLMLAISCGSKLSSALAKSVRGYK